MPDLRHLDLVVSQVQGNMSLTNMSYLRFLDLAVSKVQGNVSLNLNLEVNQV